MKNALRTLMMTTALVGFASVAHANIDHQKDTVIKTSTSQQTAYVPLQMDEATKEAHVRNLQQALNARGYDAGPVDGKMGGKTVDALNKFQRDNNLLVSDMATQQDFDALGLQDRLVAGEERTVTEKRTLMKYDLANQGSENANVYDDPNADRNGGPVYKQRYHRMSDAREADAATSYYDAQQSTYTNYSSMNR